MVAGPFGTSWRWYVDVLAADRSETLGMSEFHSSGLQLQLQKNSKANMPSIDDGIDFRVCILDSNRGAITRARTFSH